MADQQRIRKKSLIELIGDVPTLVTELVKGEIELLKAELITKLKALGIGAGLLVGAGVVLLFMVGVLLTAAILGLSTIMYGWLAALLVALFLLVIAAILVLVGYRKLKKGIPPLPTATIDGVQKDIRVIKGLGKRGRS